MTMTMTMTMTFFPWFSVSISFNSPKGRRDELAVTIIHSTSSIEVIFVREQ
jgi:hypothetical protein